MLVIVFAVLFLFASFTMGFINSQTFSRYSDKSNWEGFKNYIRMKYGMWLLFRRIEKEDKEEVMRKLKTPDSNPLMIDKRIIEVLVNEKARNAAKILYAYFQKRNINKRMLKKKSFLTTFDGNPLLNEVERDVGKKQIPNEEDVIDSIEKELLIRNRYQAKNSDISVIDYIHQFITKLRNDERKGVEKSLLVPALLRFGNDEEKKRVRTILENKEKLSKLNAVVKTLKK